MEEITKKILIGAGVTVLSGLVLYLPRFFINYVEKKRVYDWLKSNTSSEVDSTFRSTRTISSHCNLTEDRVRAICSTHKKIHLSTGQKEDMWSIYSRKEISFMTRRRLF